MAPSPEDVFAQIRTRHGAAWLDGSDGWSILAWDPREVAAGADWVTAGRAFTGRTASGDAPFSGGCLGFVGYGAGHRVEAVPAEAPTWEPESWLARYDGALCFRHADDSWHPAGTAAFRREAVALLDAVPLPEPPAAPPRRVHTTDRTRYLRGVEQIQALIADGDVYQVNLTRPVWIDDVDPWEGYRRLRRESPAPFGAWLTLGPELALLSASPELHLQLRGRHAICEPIKGTRPRDLLRDGDLAADLLASPKERAELAMIVDLVRNDLGRVAVPGTVVAGPRRVTAHPTVHHASVAVSAELEPGRDAWDALAATFPPGSVTGAPKIRACQRIAELEDGPRGAYCGVVGYIADGGDATFSVAIRTGVANGRQVRFHVGGGIVADSVPADEWSETEAKAVAWMRAFAGTGARIATGMSRSEASAPRT